MTHLIVVKNLSKHSITQTWVALGLMTILMAPNAFAGSHKKSKVSRSRVIATIQSSKAVKASGHLSAKKELPPVCNAHDSHTAATNPSHWQMINDTAPFENQSMLEAFSAAVRWHHAEEVIGNQYSHSVVKAGEGYYNLDTTIRGWVYRSLKTPWKKYTDQITRAVAEESFKHGMDPVFLLAVIENESSFDPFVVGGHGEIGLMQVTPSTAKWISEKLGLTWRGDNSLRDPATNIRIGTAYLAYLKEKFNNQSNLYLAAYNMGSLNVYRALARKVTPSEYSSRVMIRYLRYYGKLRARLKEIATPFSPAISWRTLPSTTESGPITTSMTSLTNRAPLDNTQEDGSTQITN